MPMQIRGTATPDNPPTGLAERQLSVEMGSTPPKLWVGVPTAIDPSGRILLNAATGVTISDTAPATAQVGDLWFNSTDLQTYIRYDDGNSVQWVPVNNQQGGIGLFLELAGGTMLGPLTLAGDATQPLQAVTLQQMNAAMEGKEIYTGPTAPGSPSSGDLWFDTTTNTLMVYDGANWNPAAATDVSGFLPLSGGTLTGSLTVGLAQPIPAGAAVSLSSQYISTGTAVAYNAWINAAGTQWSRLADGYAARLWLDRNIAQFKMDVAASGAANSPISFVTRWTSDFASGTLFNDGHIVARGPNNMFIGSYTSDGNYNVGFWVGADGGIRWGNATVTGSPVGVLASLTQAGNFSAIGTITPGSDAAFKENIADYTGEIDIARLRPRRFNRKGSERRELGFVHQELKEVAEELAPINSDVKCLDPVAILAAVVAECQKLKARVAELEGAR